MTKKSEWTLMGETVKKWYEDSVKPVRIRSIILDEISAKYTAVFCADMINGFCKHGNLASPRVDAISESIRALFVKAHDAGVQNFILVQEWHDPKAKEFEAFPAHGIMNTDEAETISELRELSFADKFIVFRKNTLSPAWAYHDGRYYKEDFLVRVINLHLRTAIVVGNCTDLCMRELAMHLRMWSNQHQRDLRIVIPANCVETFDLPFDVASKIGVMPHPGNMMHLLSLHEMARNGIEIVKEVV